MTKLTFVNTKLKKYIDASLDCGMSEDNLIESLDKFFSLDVDWVFLRRGIYEKQHGRLADWEKIIIGDKE